MGHLSNGDQDRGCDLVRRRTRLGRGGAGRTRLSLLNSIPTADETVLDNGDSPIRQSGMSGGSDFRPWLIRAA